MAAVKSLNCTIIGFGGAFSRYFCLRSFLLTLLCQLEKLPPAIVFYFALAWLYFHPTLLFGVFLIRVGFSEELGKVE